MATTTKVTATVSCSSDTSPGVDTPSKEGPGVLCFSFSWDPVKAGKKPKMTLVCIPVEGLKPKDPDDPSKGDKPGSGDNGKELKEKAEKEADKQTAGSGHSISVKLEDANTISLSSDGLTHVNAGCNLGKVRFSATSSGPVNGKGPGGTVTPPEVEPPPPKPPDEVMPKKRRRWQSTLKEKDLKVASVTASGQSAALGRSSEDLAGIGLMIVGFQVMDSLMLPGQFGNLLYVPFLYQPKSPMAQVVEFAERLDDAGIETILDGDVVVPVSLRLTGQRVTTFGLISALSSRGDQPPCPWSLTVLPDYPLTGRASRGMPAVGTVLESRFSPALRAPVTMDSTPLLPVGAGTSIAPAVAGVSMPTVGTLQPMESSPDQLVVGEADRLLAAPTSTRAASRPRCKDCGG